MCREGQGWERGLGQTFPSARAWGSRNRPCWHRDVRHQRPELRASACPLSPGLGSIVRAAGHTPALSIVGMEGVGSWPCIGSE